VVLPSPLPARASRGEGIRRAEKIARIGTH